MNEHDKPSCCLHCNFFALDSRHNYWCVALQQNIITKDAKHLGCPTYCPRYNKREGGEMSNTLVYVVYEEYGGGENNYSRPIAVYANKKEALAHCTDKGLMYRELEVE